MTKRRITTGTVSAWAAPAKNKTRVSIRPEGRAALGGAPTRPALGCLKLSTRPHYGITSSRVIAASRSATAILVGKPPVGKAPLP
jgi:hypothetical protein